MWGAYAGRERDAPEAAHASRRRHVRCNADNRIRARRRPRVNDVNSSEVRHGESWCESDGVRTERRRPGARDERGRLRRRRSSVSEPMHAMGKPARLEVGERGTLLAVSDGMGGARAGEVASALTLHVLRKGMTNGQVSSAEAALQASVELANQRVHAAAADPARKGIGGHDHRGADSRQSRVCRRGR